MNDPDLPISGTPGYEELADDPARIIEIVKADAAQLPRMERQRDGWDELAKLAGHVKDFLDGRISERLADNVAISVYSLNEHAANTAAGAELFRAAAAGNRQTFDQVIPEVERLDTLVDSYSGEVVAVDEDIDALPEGTTEADRKAVTDVKAGLHDELRQEWARANSHLESTHKGVAYEPPGYDGAPEWTGPDPQVYPGWDGGGPSGGRTGGAVPNPPVHGAPVTTDPPAGGDWTNDPVEGPELQTPAPAPAPAPVGPPPSPAPPPGGGPPPLPAPLPPPSGGAPSVGPKPGPGLPVGAKPPPGMGAKPTPGMGARPIGTGPNGAARPLGTGPGGSGRTTGTGPLNRAAPTGSKSSRALLPNQRNATTPSTGTSPNRAPAPAGRQNPASGRTATGPFGGRTRPTVPSVIGARGGPAPGGAKPAAPNPSGTTGTVIGARTNKGKAAKPAKRTGILVKGTAPTRRDRDWARAPKARRTDTVLAGKVIGGRKAPDDPLAAAAEQALRRRESAARAKALAEWRANREALPQHDIADGLNRTVVPDVITGTTRRTDQMHRKDIGRVFGRDGWEN